MQHGKRFVRLHYPQSVFQPLTGLTGLPLHGPAFRVTWWSVRGDSVILGLSHRRKANPLSVLLVGANSRRQRAFAAGATRCVRGRRGRGRRARRSLSMAASPRSPRRSRAPGTRRSRSETARPERRSTVRVGLSLLHLRRGRKYAARRRRRRRRGPRRWMVLPRASTVPFVEHLHAAVAHERARARRVHGGVDRSGVGVAPPVAPTQSTAEVAAPRCVKDHRANAYRSTRAEARRRRSRHADGAAGRRPTLGKTNAKGFFGPEDCRYGLG